MNPHSSPASRRPLRAQSAQFWLGAFMVAEALLSLLALLLPEATRQTILDWAFSGTASLLLTLGMLTVPGLVVGFIAHHLGWGD